MPHVAIIGDRGIPARHSGFSTLVEHLAVRLVHEYGMAVTVYCRNPYYTERSASFRGVRRVFLPAPGGKNFESIIHSNFAILHAALHRYDLVLVLDPGNAPFALPLLLRRFPTVFHTDGLGWQRRKWSRLQQRYYKWSEWVCARAASRLVVDSRAIQRYYRDEYGADSSFIPYSGEVGEAPDDACLTRFGLESRGYYLVVARLEPENNVDLIIREYRAAGCRHPLVVVGGSPYASDYADRIAAEADGQVRCLGPVYEAAVLNGLYKHAYAYLHGHEVGGTNPSLLRAMQAGAPCVAIDVVYHREVLGEAGLFFAPAAGALAHLLAGVDRDAQQLRRLGEQCRARAGALYRWDAVANAYARLFEALLAARMNRRPIADGSEFYRPELFAPATADVLGTPAS